MHLGPWIKSKGGKECQVVSAFETAEVLVVLVTVAVASHVFELIVVGNRAHNWLCTLKRKAQFQR